MIGNAITRETTEKICWILEREKNRDGKLFTSMSQISRKVDKKGIGPKEVASVINYLENKGIVKTLRRTNRQTVLEVSDSVLTHRISMEFESEINDKKSLLKAGITPKRLLEHIKENIIEDSLNVPSKKLCKEFNCEYSKLLVSLNLLKRSGKIEYQFDTGIFNITLKGYREKKNFNIEDTQILNNENPENVSHEKINKEIFKIDSVFEEIGESMRLIFEELNTLRKENSELIRNADLKDLALKKMREDRDFYEVCWIEMKERNNRLYNQIIELKNKA